MHGSTRSPPEQRLDRTVVVRRRAHWYTPGRRGWTGDGHCRRGAADRGAAKPHQRTILAAVALGVVVAAALAASVAIYSDAVRDLGLAHALRGEPAASLDIRGSSGGQPASETEYQARRALIDQSVDRYAGGIVWQTV